jgi:hypothetical protein
LKVLVSAGALKAVDFLKPASLMFWFLKELSKPSIFLTFARLLFWVSAGALRAVDFLTSASLLFRIPQEQRILRGEQAVDESTRGSQNRRISRLTQIRYFGFLQEQHILRGEQAVDESTRGSQDRRSPYFYKFIVF